MQKWQTLKKLNRNSASPPSPPPTFKKTCRCTYTILLPASLISQILPPAGKIIKIYSPFRTTKLLTFSNEMTSIGSLRIVHADCLKFIQETQGLFNFQLQYGLWQFHIFILQSGYDTQNCAKNNSINANSLNANSISLGLQLASISFFGPKLVVFCYTVLCQQKQKLKVSNEVSI